MRHLYMVFVFFIIPFFSFGRIDLQIPDSVEIFHNLTDIEKRIQGATRSFDKQVSTKRVIEKTDTVIHRISEKKSPVILLPKSYKNPLDSFYTRSSNGTLQLHPSLNADAMRGMTFRDTLFYNPLFLPAVFTGKYLPRDLSFYQTKQRQGISYELIPKEKTFAPKLQHYDFVNNIRKYYSMSYPDKIKYSVFNFNETLPAVNDADVTKQFNPFRELIKTESNVSLQAPEVERVQIGRKYWVFSGEHSLQFSQNYFSNNWHKGGTSNMNINNYHVFIANYKKDKVRFNNKLEWRLSIYNAPDDSLRKFRIGDDLIRYYGDFGIDAFARGWSYSTNMEAKTQLFNNHIANSRNLRSALLSPLYVNAGVGMKYELDKKSETVRHRRLRWTLALAPASLNYRYVLSNNVDVKRYGIPPEKKSVFDVGSTLTSILKYDITRYVTWDSRFKYFTSYKKIEAEFENTLNMSLSNYFSTRLYLNLRFDDSVPTDKKFGYLQVNETISFGLNFKW